MRSSVFVFVGGFAGDVFEERIVVGWFADHIFFAGPVAEVVKLAAFAAKWKFRVGGRVRRLLADRAAEFHALKNTAKCLAMCMGRCGKAGAAFCAAATGLNPQDRGVAGAGRSPPGGAAAEAIAAWMSASFREG